MPYKNTQDDQDPAQERCSLLQVLDSGWTRFIKSGLVTAFMHLPAFVAGFFCIFSGRLLLLPVVLVILGPICMIAWCGMYDTVLRVFRREPGFWWNKYKNALCRNRRSCILPGLLFGFAFGSLASAYSVLLLTDVPSSLGSVALLVVCTIGLTGIYSIVTAQLALIQAPFLAILRNAFLLIVPYFFRIAVSSLLQCLLWGCLAALFPFSFPVILLAGFWVAALLALWPIYRKPLDEVFRIEERLSQDYNKRSAEEP